MLMSSDFTSDFACQDHVSLQRPTLTSIPYRAEVHARLLCAFRRWYARSGCPNLVLVKWSMIWERPARANVPISHACGIDRYRELQTVLTPLIQLALVGRDTTPLQPERLRYLRECEGRA